MKTALPIICLAVLVLLVRAAVAQPQSPQPAQTGANDWGRVERLERDARIEVKVTAGLTVPCLYAGATPSSLFCDDGSVHGARIERAEVVQVRRARGAGRAGHIVGGAAVIGFVAGAAAPGSQGLPWSIRGVAGAGVGALVGCVVAFPAAFFPGRLVYRRAAPVSGH